jgi:hypothetical protein
LDPFIVRLPGGDAFPKELNVGTTVTIMIFMAKDMAKHEFKITVTPKKSKYELVPIFTGETKPAMKYAADGTKIIPPPPDFVSSFILDESGTTYEIKVTRLGTDPEKDKDKDIFTENLQTRARYRFGSHVGVFIPFGQSSEYSLGYATPADANATIMESKRRNVTMIFIGSFYPFNFEPDGECLSYRRIQLNLATELSSSIFKKIYFGLGYDLTYASISLLGRFATVQELQSGFKPGDQITGGLKSVPTVSKNKLDWGLTVCMPMNLMIAWLGKSLGLK